VFKDITMISPIRAITRFKMQRSLGLMRAGNSVKQTAQALGYSSTFHFSAAFLAVMGKRPSSYIELMNQKRLRQKKDELEVSGSRPALRAGA
jgi:AraC-like DNA-binding protein